MTHSEDDAIDAMLVAADRFYAFFCDIDVQLMSGQPRLGARRTIGSDRGGGRYVVIDDGDPRLATGVWWLGSEGQEDRLARDLPEFFERLGEGFTPDDLAVDRAVPTGRRAPGLLRSIAGLRAGRAPTAR